MKARDRRLSELEGAVLGVVKNHSPCTAYVVRKVFKASPVHHWKASAGAIYPVVERLECGGLLRSEEVARGRQKTRHYRVTKQGREALREWLLGAGEQLVVPPDPLRTRVFFLSTLGPRARRELLERPLEMLNQQLLALEDDCRRQETEDRFAFLAAKGALAVARARRDWILDLLQELG